MNYKDYSLSSIIIPCSNQLAYTRHCIESLARHTRPPWELVAVDNGSTDGTAHYLAGVRDAAPFRVEVITNPGNRGFPAACYQGLAAALGQYVVLLNNDAVVTDAWLEMLVALVDSGPSIGMVGPMSNDAPPPQLVDPVPYRDLEEMHAFASRWRAENRGRWFTAEKLSGFCLLAKRAAIAATGGIDERSGPGLFDDDDLAMRMRRAGYELAVAKDLFVHHFGGRTFAGAGMDAEALMAANRGRFLEQRGAGAPVGGEGALRPRGPRPTPASASGRPKVSLTMIVRDEEANLPHCLGSARGLFDEIVVVDTGSTDRTVEIARSHGAEVFHFPWVGDFAAARNAALAHATGDYAFWLDADDRVEPSEYPRLEALLAGLATQGDPAAYVVRCACDPDPDGGGATVVDHVRLFPLRDDVRWAYRVHEQILPSLRRAGVEVRWSDCTVRHTGYNDPALRRRKLHRDRAILEVEAADRPGDPFVAFNLGQIALDLGDHGDALGHLNRSLAGSAPADSITRKLHALVALCHQRLGDLQSAQAACEAGLAAFDDDAELLFRRAVIHRHRGEPAEAASCWRRILTLRPPERFSSVDAGIYGHLTRRNLAALAEEGGDRDEAARLWVRVLAEVPGDATARAALAKFRGRPEGQVLVGPPAT